MEKKLETTIVMGIKRTELFTKGSGHVPFASMTSSNRARHSNRVGAHTANDLRSSMHHLSIPGAETLFRVWGLGYGGSM